MSCDNKAARERAALLFSFLLSAVTIAGRTAVSYPIRTIVIAGSAKVKASPWPRWLRLKAGAAPQICWTTRS